MSKRIMPKSFALGFAALILSSCGSPTDDTDPSVAVTKFEIRPADLYVDPPNDVCRSRDAEFLQKLLERAAQLLPVEQRSAVQFHDFFVSGENYDAILRFKTDRGERKGVIMYALGSFDPKSCMVGKLTVGEGVTPYVSDHSKEVEEP